MTSPRATTLKATGRVLLERQCGGRTVQTKCGLPVRTNSPGRSAKISFKARSAKFSAVRGSLAGVVVAPFELAPVDSACILRTLVLVMVRLLLHRCGLLGAPLRFATLAQLENHIAAFSVGVDPPHYRRRWRRPNLPTLLYLSGSIKRRGIALTHSHFPRTHTLAAACFFLFLAAGRGKNRVEQERRVGLYFYSDDFFTGWV
jgi:hypothetical protein